MKDGVARIVWWGTGAAVVAFTAWLASQNATHARAATAQRDAEAPGGAGSGAGSGSGAADGGVLDGSAAAVGDGGVGESDGGMDLASLFFDASTQMMMPSSAPRAVHVGVILVQFEGAEGASSSARGKKDALAEANRLTELAKSDWKAAVKQGDSGSAEDIGRIPRGVLDPRTEIATFSLAAGDVSEPVETPKGFWIVKRID